MLDLLLILMLMIFFNDTASPEIYTYGHMLSLHDALPSLRHALAHVATQHLAQERHRDPPLLGQRSAVGLVEQPGQARQVAVDAAQQPVDRRLVDCQPAAPRAQPDRKSVV